MFSKLATASLKTLFRSQCVNCCKVRVQNYATRKRFYKGTGIIQNENKWEVTLDHRRLKTPNGKPLLIHNEALARGIAAEWDAQSDVITQPTMHLTALCNTAMDNPGKLTKHDIASYLMDFIATDTLLFASEEEDLRALQERKWGPIIDWFQKRFDVKQEVSQGLEAPPVTTETRAALAKHYLSYDFPSLNAIVFGVEALKSPLLMLAAVDRRLEPSEAVMLSRLEEEYQLRRWGRVAWAHGVSQAELTARVAAALLVVHSSGEVHEAKVKAKQPA
ncbi:unnamed protein product [Plutella xylostella]|uniref:(diamondback moth) hypothetical protein n=1 Tax=Plutella xylostella TaxID=51655 RepID=A0A8S4DH13_PLUXY|nr:unnamed protein product [Plutella xylostella]